MRAGHFSVVASVVALGLVPTPVGTGPRYRPPPKSPSAHFVCRSAQLQKGPRVHIELFARRRVVLIPAGIGLNGERRRLGRVVSADCRARVWTLDPSGIVDYEGRVTLGGAFRVWGQTLGPSRLLSFHGRVSVFVDGLRRRGDPRTLRFRPGAEIVLELGGYVPPHSSFLFPPR